MATLRTLILMAAWLAIASFLRAVGPAEATRPVEIRFVPPGADGTVSLGIYNAAGKLVRVLCDEWPFGRFEAGRDALSTTWDGRDAAGQTVPAGTYSARGFIVGEVEVDGEAFYFNDWIDGPEAPRIEAVRAQQILPGGDILLAARLAGAAGALVRYSPESDVRWHSVASKPRTQQIHNAQLAVSDTLALVLLDNELLAVKLSDGRDAPTPISRPGIKDIAARGAQLAILDAAGITFFALPDFTPQGDAGPLPVPMESATLLEDGAVAAAASDGSVWVWRSGWTRLDIPDDVRVREVSAGRGRTFWALQQTQGGALSIAQYSPEDGRLAEWTPGVEDGVLVSVSGATERDLFVATLDQSGAQRVVAIRRKKDGGGWEFVFDKKITASAHFGWAEGKLTAFSNELPEELKVSLAVNPLDPAAPRSLTLRATADDTGTGLSTTDGLPLLRVTTQPGIGRVMLVRGVSPGTARFFQGDGACVEEYRLSKLNDITAFDAGALEMTGSGEAPPPPPEDPKSSADE